MEFRTHRFTVETRGFTDIHDLTPAIIRLIGEEELGEGSVLVFVPGSTGGVTTIECESGALADLTEAFERIAPQSIHYAHDARWGDGNGFSHVRAALCKPDLEIPVVGGQLGLGTWQQVVLLDFDNGPRQRTVICQLRGEFGTP
jgi:secondary thiamine-phosphate synthase enzyme